MTKTLLSGAAALAILLAAPSAFAQEANVDATVEVESEAVDAAEHAMDATMDATDDAADAVEDAADDAMDEADEAMDEAADEMEEAADAVDEAVDVDVDANVSATVACPEGTEAQDDGSCMVTGDWSPED